MADGVMEPVCKSPQTNNHYFHMDADYENFVPFTDILIIDNNSHIPDVEEIQEDDQNEAEDNYYIPEPELSPDGILDELTVERGLSNLGRSADGLHQVYLNISIPGFSLVDISVLAEYAYLQKVEIPYNNISDLSPLGKLPNLLMLDASHNLISVMLDFTPPLNLQDVDLSFNQLTAMSDLSAHHALNKLVLDSISEIRGLQKCKRLNHLSLTHNLIEVIDGLENLPIKTLNLCHNKIRKIENLETLKKLQTLNLSGNCIRSLKGLEGHYLLETIDLEDNEVIDVLEISHIQKLLMLRDLNLLRNPIQELPDCRLSVLYHIPHLTELDRCKVAAEEKVSARNMFEPSLEVVAARDHIMHVVYNFLQPSRVWDSTLPNVETPYPMLVLVGPQGSGKRNLAMKLVEEFADYFGYGLCHTTRLPRAEEVHGKDYFFVTTEQFETDIKMGQFIQSVRLNDQWYGLQMESIERVAREGLACVVHMELEGMLTLKRTYFEPRYVLIMPLDKEVHEHRLRQLESFSEEYVEKTLKRAEMYCQYNRDHPGFFDMMISCDDIAEAYHKLRQLVMEYLGISKFMPEAEIHTHPAFEIGDPGQVNTAVTPSALGARTWSKPSLTDSNTQIRAQVNSPTGRGIVEEESLKRRQSAAKEVVTGYVPPIYQQILIQYPPRTAPQTMEEQGLDSDENLLMRASSAPNNSNTNAFPVNATISAHPGSPDSTPSNGSFRSNLSDLGSATELQQPRSPKGYPALPTTSSLSVINNILPTEVLNPLNLISEKRFNSGSKSHSHQAHSPSVSRQLSGSGHSNRPGSERHKVLPPIVSAQ